MADSAIPESAPEPFAAILGAAFAQLPEPVRRLHRGGARRFAGRASVERGGNLLARCLATIAGLPPACADGAIVVELEPLARGERWTRRFNGHVMRSRLWADRRGSLREQLGPLCFRFALEGSGDALRWHVIGVRALGLPLPAAWFRGVAACESVADGRYVFEVRAAVPMAGEIVRYRGWLAVD
jgi:hypothetical protein